MFDLPNIRQAMAAFTPDLTVPRPTTRQAAVAIVLREAPTGLEMLFIKRAEKEGDPWSGHMAYPGGHLETSDTSLRAAAERETLEEIGLDLSGADYLGAIDHEQATPRGVKRDMIIAPHVFEISGNPSFSPNYEVDEVVWTALHPMVNNHIHDVEKKHVAGEDINFNGYRLERGHFVWGLTYRIVKSFFTTIDPNWVYPPEVD